MSSATVHGQTSASQSAVYLVTFEADGRGESVRNLSNPARNLRLYQMRQTGWTWQAVMDGTDGHVVRHRRGRASVDCSSGAK